MRERKRQIETWDLCLALNALNKNLSLIGSSATFDVLFTEVCKRVCTCAAGANTPFLQDEQRSQLDQNSGGENCQNLQSFEPADRRQHSR